MNRSNGLWLAICIVSVAGTVLFAGSFAYAVATVLFPQGEIVEVVEESGPPLSDEDSVSIVALGDSLTAGFGDSTGQGYVGRLQEKLRGIVSVPVYVTANFARSGYTTTQVLDDLESRKGVTEALRQADIVVLTAGGNDLFSVGDEIDVSSFVGKIPEVRANIRNILEKIKDIAPDTRIFYIGLYNPFIDFKEIQGTTSAVQEWNNAVFSVAETIEGVTFVPTFDLFENDAERFLSSDDYHLNDEGYDRVAARLAMLME